MTKRLSNDTLRTVARSGSGSSPALDLPDFDRRQKPRIVHIGVGAFARAHLGVYADDLLRLGIPATIAGVSLRSPSAEQQLAPQDCLYSVTEREPGVESTPRVIGSITSVATGVDSAISAIVDGHVRMVTLTVTEKGYEVPSSELENPVTAESAPAVLARALAGCRSIGIEPPPVIASLDNLASNGQVLRTAVLVVAERLDPSLPEWIDANVAFPSSVVDRMVPATSAADLNDVETKLGLVDQAAVVAEHYRSWAIEYVEGLLPFDKVRVEIVDDVSAHEQRKLWLLNGPHSALAYAGLIIGVSTIAEATQDPIARQFVESVVADVLEVADIPSTLQPACFAGETLRRFANPALGHTCVQVGADGSRKLPQRIFPVVTTRLATGLPTARLAMVTALWVAAVGRIPVAGRVLPEVADPAAVDVVGLGPEQMVKALLEGEVDPTFMAQVDSQLKVLLREGPRALEMNT